MECAKCKKDIEGKIIYFGWTYKGEDNMCADICELCQDEVNCAKNKYNFIDYLYYLNDFREQVSKKGYHL
jgi:hypothetical protein